MIPLTIIGLRFQNAPYGKHYRTGWGPTISPPLAWFLMESPTLWLTILLYPLGRHSSHPLPFFLTSLYVIHYINRTIIYPLRQKTVPKSQFPISIALQAFLFNIVNAYTQTRSISHYRPDEDIRQALVRFVLGGGLFVWGMWVNITSDAELLRLRKKGKGKYVVPMGGWFDYVTCPNYMGETVEWLGWSIMCWSPAAFGFFLFTCANLGMRAASSRKWYLEKFADEFPAERMAFVPLLY